MKILITVILAILVLYFQILIAPKMMLLEIIPNFLLGFLIFINIRFEKKFPVFLAFFLGIAFDLTNPQILGLNTISFLIISFLINKYHQNINKERFDIVFLGIFAINLLYYFIFFLFYLFSVHIKISFVFTFLFAVLYNSAISFVTTVFFFLLSKIKISING